MSERDGHLPEDPQTQRTRWELWAILITGAGVLIASVAWRSIGHHRAGPDLSSTTTPRNTASGATVIPAPPPAAVGVQPRTP